jgi:hypothetical protein
MGEAERVHLAAHRGEQGRGALEREAGADLAGRQEVHFDPDLPPSSPLPLQQPHVPLAGREVEAGAAPEVHIGVHRLRQPADSFHRLDAQPVASLGR